MAGKKLPKQYARPFEEMQLFPDRLDEPLHCKAKDARIFVDSMSDLFHPEVPFEFIDKVIAIIGRCQQHRFQILTKRPVRMSHYFLGLRDDPKQAQRLSFGGCCIDHKHKIAMTYRRKGFLKSLWLGASISTQADADKNIPILLQIPAAIRFVSLEPMLERIDLKYHLPYSSVKCSNYIRGETLQGIDWVIIGCESGPKARLCTLDDIRYVVEQCKAADVPVFVKQVPINGKCNRNPDDWPVDVRVQEYPKNK
jgi:protein gp37